MASFSENNAINFLAEQLSPCGGKIYGLFRAELLRNFFSENLLIEDYRDALLVDYVNLNSFSIIVPKILFYYSEDFNINRVSLSSNKFKIFKFDHFSYIKACVQLIFRNHRYSNFSKFLISFGFIFLFFILKIRSRFGTHILK